MAAHDGRQLIERFGAVLRLDQLERHAAGRLSPEFGDRHEIVDDQVRLLAARAPVDRARYHDHGVGLEQLAEPGVVFRPTDRANESVHVLQVEHAIPCVRGARSGLLHIRELECADESADHDVAFRLRFTEIAGAVCADGREDVLVFAKRMAVHVVAENLLLG